jgi:hypothetical protein
MLAVLVCVVTPFAMVGLSLFLASQYGDELFGLDWPAHELNRDDDYRLIKLRLGREALAPPVAPPGHRPDRGSGW